MILNNDEVEDYYVNLSGDNTNLGGVDDERWIKLGCNQECFKLRIETFLNFQFLISIQLFITWPFDFDCHVKFDEIWTNILFGQKILTDTLQTNFEILMNHESNIHTQNFWKHTNSTRFLSISDIFSILSATTLNFLQRSKAARKLQQICWARPNIDDMARKFNFKYLMCTEK